MINPISPHVLRVLVLACLLTSCGSVVSGTNSSAQASASATSVKPAQFKTMALASSVSIPIPKDWYSIYQGPTPPSRVPMLANPTIDTPANEFQPSAPNSQADFEDFVVSAQRTYLTDSGSPLLVAERASGGRGSNALESPRTSVVGLPPGGGSAIRIETTGGNGSLQQTTWIIDLHPKVLIVRVLQVAPQEYPGLADQLQAEIRA